MNHRRLLYALGIFLLPALSLLNCASTPKANEDPRLNVQASMSLRTQGPSTSFLYVVWIRNLSENTLFIRRVEVEPIGGGHVRPAYETIARRIEPGEEVEVRVWAELDPKETVMGVGDALARIIVAFDDGAEKVLGSYLVNLH